MQLTFNAAKSNSFIQEQAKDQLQRTVAFSAKANKHEDVYQEKEKKKKEGIITKIKRFGLHMENGWIAFTGYTKAALAGVFQGGIAGGLTFGGMKIYESAKPNLNNTTKGLDKIITSLGKNNKITSEVKQSIMQTLEAATKALKNNTDILNKQGLPKALKIAVPAAVGLAVLALKLWNASFDINEKRNNNRHRYFDKQHNNN